MKIALLTLACYFYYQQLSTALSFTFLAIPLINHKCNQALMFKNTAVLEKYFSVQKRLLFAQVLNMTLFGKGLYRIFVLTMLGLAIFYSNQAINGWNNAPIMVSGV